MATWIIEPHDPLIFRDGRPFGPTPGARAKTLQFPFPSTIAGGVRTRAGQVNGIFDTSDHNIAEVKKIQIRGPLLALLSSHDNTAEVKEWILPAPSDALAFEVENSTSQVNVKQLVPVSFPTGALTDFEPVNDGKLQLVGLEQPDNSKSAKNAPRYWKWDTFQSWLLNPTSICKQVAVKDLGYRGPQSEQRLHVSIDPATGIARDGALFETSGLEFTDGDNLENAERLALVVEVNENGLGQKVEPGLTHLAGERRIVSWRKSSTPFPTCPSELEEDIVKAKACRVILLTPAFFSQGYLPTKLLHTFDNVTPELKAIVVQRPQVVSGWSLERRPPGPKPTRRLAQAGTVLFLKLQGDDASVRRWVQRTWMQSITDSAPETNYEMDGFGLAILGTWSGNTVTMKDRQS